MNAHKNARTTPYVRELMTVRRREGWPVGEIAEAAGVSSRTVYKWLARKSGEDRSSRAHRIANRLADPIVSEIASLRHQRMTGAALARRLKLARATVAGWLRRLGMGKLRLLEPKPLFKRYERERAGEIVHLDIKKLGRFKQLGHRVIARGAGRSHRVGWDFVHVAIDDATRIAYVEILPDEKQESATAFLKRALSWMAARRIKVERIMTDNGAAYRSKLFAAALSKVGLRHLFTRP